MGLDGSSGCFNILLGECAGMNMTSGASNIAIGCKAMGNGVTTGNRNIALGKLAGCSITSANNNIILGWYAGRETTIGKTNIFGGYSAAKCNTSGCYNVIFGLSAIGAYAGQHLDASGSGVSNVILIGHCAGYKSHGINGIAIGQGAAGSDNNKVACNGIAIGALAGRNLCGDFNISMGFCGGYGSGTVSSNTGTRNISIGCKAAMSMILAFRTQ